MKGNSSETEKCHDTRAEAVAHLAALRINVEAAETARSFQPMAVLSDRVRDALALEALHLGEAPANLVSIAQTISAGLPLLEHEIRHLKRCFLQLAPRKQLRTALPTDPTEILWGLMGGDLGWDWVRNCATALAPLGRDVQTDQFSLVKGLDIDGDGTLAVQVIGIPFYGPALLKGADVYGDFFDPETDTGTLDVAYSYFDHRQSDRYLPKGTFGTRQVGVAHRKAVSEDGWLYEIVIDRHERYRNLLKHLSDGKFLGASSEVKFREDDTRIPGRIKTWHPISVDLTPTYANPNGVVLATYMKSFVEPEEINPMPEETTPTTPAIPTPATTPPPTDPEPPEDDEEGGGGEEHLTLAQRLQRSVAPETPAGTDENGVLAQILARLERLEEGDRIHRKTAKSVGELVEALEVLPDVLATKIVENMDDDYRTSRTEAALRRSSAAPSPSTRPKKPVTNGLNVGKLPPTAPGQS